MPKSKPHDEARSDQTSGKKQIHIIGGGPAGLAAAFRLAQLPNYQENYDIIVYQSGWRLGGKCASSRNSKADMRVEEHGLHLFGGSYHNTLSMLRTVYDELMAHGKISRKFEDAFFPADKVKVANRTPRGWHLIDAQFPTNDLKIGQLPDALLPSTILTALEGWARTILKNTAYLTGKPIVQLAEAVDLIENALGLYRRPSWMPPTPGEVLKDLAGLSGTSSPTSGQTLDIKLVAELMLAAVRGITMDGIPAKGFDAINNEEFSEWLQRHGASEDAIESAYQRAGYDYVFGYVEGDPTRPSLAAGVALKGLLRTYLAFHGSILLHSAANLGETYILPLYWYLKDRGVTFKMFHQLKGLSLNATQTKVTQLSFNLQPTKDEGPAIVPLKDTFFGQVWADAPAGFDGADHAAEDQYENPFFEFPDTSRSSIDIRVHDGPHARDRVILAIPLAAIEILKLKVGDATTPQDAKSVLSAIPSWKDAFSGHASVATGAVQFWFDASEPVLRGIKDVTATALPGPFSTWAELSHQLPQQAHKANQVSLNYFCGQLDDRDYPAASLKTHAQLAAGREKLKSAFDIWWQENSVLLFPNLSAGERKSLPQNLYVRLNVLPSERYVLALPGSIRKRIRADETGIENMTVAGDWTRNGGNAGAVEYAVMSGFQAAQLIQRSTEPIFGETDFG